MTDSPSPDQSRFSTANHLRFLRSHLVAAHRLVAPCASGALDVPRDHGTLPDDDAIVEPRESTFVHQHIDADGETCSFETDFVARQTKPNQGRQEITFLIRCAFFGPIPRTCTNRPWSAVMTRSTDPK